VGCRRSASLARGLEEAVRALAGLAWDAVRNVKGAQQKAPTQGNGELGPRYRASQGYRRPMHINMHQGAIPVRWGNRLNQDLQAEAQRAAAPPRWCAVGPPRSPGLGAGSVRWANSAYAR